MAGKPEDERIKALVREAQIKRFLDETVLFDRPPLEPEAITPADVEVIEANETEWIAVTHSFTAEEYASFHKNFDYFDKIIQNEKHQALVLRVLEDVCNDEYSSDERSRTFVAFTEEAGLVGQIRLGFGRSNAPFPLEAMSLFDAPGGWPHQRDGVPDERIAEIGRIVVAPGQRPTNTSVILKSLLKHAFGYASSNGYEQAYIVKPTKHPDPNAPEGRLAPLHARLVEIGTEPELVRPAVLRPDNPVAQMYTGYFGALDPRVFRWRQIPRIAA
jgi:hypothetical protein